MKNSSWLYFVFINKEFVSGLGELEMSLIYHISYTGCANPITQLMLRIVFIFRYNQITEWSCNVLSKVDQVYSSTDKIFDQLFNHTSSSNICSTSVSSNSYFCFSNSFPATDISYIVIYGRSVSPRSQDGNY